MSVGAVAGVYLGVDEPHSSARWIFVVTLTVAGYALRGDGRRASRASIVLLALVGVAVGWTRGRQDFEGYRTRVAPYRSSEQGSSRDVVAEILESAVSTADGSRVLPVYVVDPPLRLRLRVRVPDDAPSSDLDELLRGDRVRFPLRVSDPPARRAHEQAAAVRARGDDLVATVKSPRLIERLPGTHTDPLRVFDDIRSRARSRLQRALPDDEVTRAVISAMTLGDGPSVDSRVRQSFRDAGIAHLLAVSGLHVALVLGAALRPLSRGSGRSRGARTVIGIVLAASLVPLVGSGAPVVRAAACAVWFLVADRLGRRHDGLHALAVVAAGLALWRPAVVLGVSYQLSFAATAGLALAASPRREASLTRRLTREARASTAAYLATAPLTSWHFHFLTPVAIASGFAATAACAAVVASGALVIAAAEFEPAAAVARFAVRTLLRTSEVVGEVPLGSLRVPRPQAPVIAAAVLLPLAALRAGSRSPIRITAIGFSALAFVWVHLGPPPEAWRAELAVRVLEVGQGQAVEVRDPDRGCSLFDAGPIREGFDAGERVVLPALLDRGCRHVPVLVISHPHADHVGGATAIVEGISVGELWIAPGELREREVRSLVDRAQERGVAVASAERGMRRARSGLQFEVLHPTRSDLDLEPNDRSVVVRVAGRCGSALLPGDASSEAERRILARNPNNLRSTLLVLGHHGGRDATGERWLDAVDPRFAVASAGLRNPFGHPHPDVLDRLRRRGVVAARTDRDGDVLWRCEIGGVDRFTSESGDAP